MSSLLPKIEFEDQTIHCEVGESLRSVLRKAKLPLYNGIAELIHCRGLGTCGTCTVKIEGDVSELTSVEKWRLGFPPHERSNDLRLACQCRVLGDLKIQKYPGLWGHKVPNSNTSPE